MLPHAPSKLIVFPYHLEPFAGAAVPHPAAFTTTDTAVDAEMTPAAASDEAAAELEQDAEGGYALNASVIYAVSHA
jgi:hypothetical protein